MDLSSFQQIQTLNQDLNNKRKTKSSTHCQTGINALVQAYQEKFTNKQLIAEAAAALLEAIKISPREPLPYIGMAFILFFFGEKQKALEYLLEAKRNNPSHPELDAVISHMLAYKKQDNQPRVTLSESSGSPNESIDYDALYDRLESFIIDQVRLLMHEQPQSLQPSADDSALNVFQKRWQELKDLYQKICLQVETVGQEIDTTDLCLKMKPLEASLKRFENLVAVTEQMVKLKQEINQEKTAADQALEQVKQLSNAEEIKSIEQQVDIFMDHCDRIADTLDTLEQKKYNIGSVETQYSQLISLIEKLRDAIDDALSETTHTV